MRAPEVRAAVEAGALVADLRLPGDFAEGHIPGAVSIQFNRAEFPQRAGDLLPGDRVVVVLAEPEPVARLAVDMLEYIGRTVPGYLEGGLSAWRAAGLPVEGLPRISVDELHDELYAYRVIDAREAEDFAFGHIAGALLLPPSEAWAEAGRLPSDLPLAVVCQTRIRSAFVASVLARAGAPAVLVTGGVADWVERGFPLVREEAEGRGALGAERAGASR